MDGIIVSVSIFGNGFFCLLLREKGDHLWWMRSWYAHIPHIIEASMPILKECKMIPYNKTLVSNAQELRKNMTPEEKHIWYDFLKRLPYTVKRQHNIDNFIVDFYIPKKKIVIEIDGIQHQTAEHKESDKKRDDILSNWDITVLRYSNESVNTNFVAITADILKHLGLNFADLKPDKVK